MEVEYRKAVKLDFDRVVRFVDFWLTGGGLADGVPGSAHDFFVPQGLHEKYFAKYNVLLAIYEGEIVGWAVKANKGVLIHLLVAGTFRGNGIGGEMLRRMSPDVVRSKFDQSTGDPAAFYRKHGYVKVLGERLGKKKNIELFTKEDSVGGGSQKGDVEVKSAVFPDLEKADITKKGRRRSVDVLAKKLHLGNFHPERF